MNSTAIGNERRKAAEASTGRGLSQPRKRAQPGGFSGGCGRSGHAAKTIGMADLLQAERCAPPDVTMTSTLSRTNSVAMSA
jgi:hypothetical protein